MVERESPAYRAEIHFNVVLDENRLPLSIEWSATDAPGEGSHPTKSILLSVWNSEEKKAMRIDLWTKDMLVDEMKLFVFQTLVTLSETLERATSERAAADEMRRFAERLGGILGVVR
jgi:gliding motility-associated protein GldC